MRPKPGFGESALEIGAGLHFTNDGLRQNASAVYAGWAPILHVEGDCIISRNEAKGTS